MIPGTNHWHLDNGQIEFRGGSNYEMEDMLPDLESAIDYIQEQIGFPIRNVLEKEMEKE